MRKRNNDHALLRDKCSDVKPKMIELDRNIGHKSAMSICQFFIDREEPTDLVDQVIHDTEGIGDASVEWANRMDKLFAEDFSFEGAIAL